MPAVPHRDIHPSLIAAVFSVGCSASAPVGSANAVQTQHASGALATEAPSSATPPAPGRPSWRLSALSPLSVSTEACAAEVVPSPAFNAVGSWLDVFHVLAASGFANTPARSDGEAQTRLCELASVDCNGSLEPLLLAMGDDAQPAAYRFGVVLQTASQRRVYGPWEAGVQVYHCVPEVQAVTATTPSWLSHVGLAVTQMNGVLTGPDGECAQDAAEGCVRACLPTQVERWDFYFDASRGDTLLVRQRRQLGEAQQDALGELKVEFDADGLSLPACDAKRLRVVPKP